MIISFTEDYKNLLGLWNLTIYHREMKLITRLHVGLSHLREHKFKHSFQDILNPISVAVLMLNQLLITFSPVPCKTMKDITSSAL